MNERFGRLAGRAAIASLLLGAVCWAGTQGVDKFRLANIKANGHLGSPAGTVNFNYVVDKKGYFIGSASGKVHNYSNLNAAFNNVGSFNNLTVITSLYLVDDVGNAVYTAAGSKP